MRTLLFSVILSFLLLQGRSCFGYSSPGSRHSEPLIQQGNWGLAAGYANSTGVYGLEIEYAMRSVSFETMGTVFIGLGAGFEDPGGSIGFRWMHSLEALNDADWFKSKFDSWDTYLYGELVVGPMAHVEEKNSGKSQEIIGPGAAVGFRCYLKKRIGFSVSLGAGYAPYPSWYEGSDSSVVPVLGLTVNYAI